MKLLGARPGVADVLTLANASCGAAAILVVATRDAPGSAGAALRVVTLLLLSGTVLDVLDGAAARRWGGTDLGGPLDGMADAVTFGLAPAIAIGAVALPGEQGAMAVFVGIGVCVYAGGALLRLADFAANRSGDTQFTGLPSPLAAVSVLCLAFLSPPPMVVAFGLAALGLMMVSLLHYPANRGAALALSLSGWAFGLVGLSGLVDIRIPALATLAVITVVVPAATAVGRRGVPADVPT